MAVFSASAIPKCRDRLEKAREALFRCRNASDYAAFVSAWADFLIFSGAVIHAVEAGAQDTPQGRQWYGGIRRRDRADDLLRYMLQARNEEEHGRNLVSGYNAAPGVGVINPETSLLEPIANIDPSTTKVDENGWETSHGPPYEPRGWKFGIGMVPTGPMLVPIRDSKFLQTYPPPSRHKGALLKVNTPIEVGEVYLTYLAELIDEAASLV